MAQVPHYNPNGYLSVLLVIFDPSTAVALLVAVGAFVLICIFDISGVLFGLATLGGLQNDETDEIPGSLWALIASSVGRHCGCLVRRIKSHHCLCRMLWVWWCMHAVYGYSCIQ